MAKKKRIKSAEAPKIEPVIYTEQEQEIAKEFIDKVNSDIAKEINNTPEMLKYDGNNAKQVMEFCGAFHFECQPGRLLLHMMGPRSHSSRANICLVMAPGQSIVKKDGLFEVID